VLKSSESNRHPA